jgi:HSP20 family protein
LDFDSPLSPFAEFEHMLEHIWDGSRPAGIFGGYDVDIYSDDDHIFLEAELPGLSREDVQVSVEEGVLTIAGRKTHEKIEKDHVHHLQERYFGSFSRSFTLPATVDAKKVEATMTDGVLRVLLAKREKAKTKRIEVKGK